MYAQTGIVSRYFFKSILMNSKARQNLESSWIIFSSLYERKRLFQSILSGCFAYFKIHTHTHTHLCHNIRMLNFLQYQNLYNICFSCSVMMIPYYRWMNGSLILKHIHYLYGQMILIFINIKYFQINTMNHFTSS